MRRLAVVEAAKANGEFVGALETKLYVYASITLGKPGRSRAKAFRAESRASERLTARLVDGDDGGSLGFAGEKFMGLAGLATEKVSQHEANCTVRYSPPEKALQSCLHRDY